MFPDSKIQDSPVTSAHNILQHNVLYLKFNKYRIQLVITLTSVFLDTMFTYYNMVIVTMVV